MTRKRQNEVSEKRGRKKMAAQVEQTSLGLSRPAVEGTTISEPITVHLGRKKKRGRMGKEDRNKREKRIRSAKEAQNSVAMLITSSQNK